MWPLWLCCTFPHYLINNMIFKKEKKLLNIECLFWFFLQLLCETLLISRRTEQDMIKSVYWYYVKFSLVVTFWWNVTFIDRFWKILKYQINENSSSGSWVVPCGQTGGQTWWRRFCNFVNMPKNGNYVADRKYDVGYEIEEKLWK